MISSTPRLANKTALVTGGACGIGLAITELFLAAGAKVFVLDFSSENIQSARERLGSKGYHEEYYYLCEADAADEDAVAAAVDECAMRFGGIDIAILNAGIPFYGAIADTTMAVYDRVMRINARSAFLGIKYAAQKIQAGGRGGSIVLAASLASIEAFPDLGPYSMSKFAVRAIAVTAAAEYAKDKIRVNCVSPGYVSTQMIQTLPDLEEKLKISPFERAAEPMEVAKLYLYLASDDAAMITGSNYRIDGGMSRQ